MAGHVTHVRGGGEVHTGFWWGKPDENRQLGRPRHKWEDNIQLDLKEIWRVWPELIWLRMGDKWEALVNMMTQHHVPQNAEGLLDSQRLHCVR
jgi:hypothetical protein